MKRTGDEPDPRGARDEPVASKQKAEASSAGNEASASMGHAAGDDRR
jgi:hypothetical protein